MKSIPEFIDGKILKQETIDQEFHSTNLIKLNAAYNVDKQLIRFKFLEALVRIAILKYPKAATPFDSVKQCFE